MTIALDYRMEPDITREADIDDLLDGDPPTCPLDLRVEPLLGELFACREAELAGQIKTDSR